MQNVYSIRAINSPSQIVAAPLESKILFQLHRLSICYSVIPAVPKIAPNSALLPGWCQRDECVSKPSGGTRTYPRSGYFLLDTKSDFLFAFHVVGLSPKE